MRILIDTNSFIYGENDPVLPANLEKLLKILNVINAKILIHPKSIEELKRDLIVGYPSNDNNYVDNAILYSVYKDAVDFLITEDKGIQKKSDRLSSGT